MKKNVYCDHQLHQGGNVYFPEICLPTKLKFIHVIKISLNSTKTLKSSCHYIICTYIIWVFLIWPTYEF